MKTEEELRAAFRMIRDDPHANLKYKQGSLHVLAWVLDLFPPGSFQARYYDAAYVKSGAIGTALMTDMELTDEVVEETNRVFKKV